MNQVHKQRYARRSGKCMELVLYLFILFPLLAGAQLPTDFQEETLVSGLNQPITMVFLPDGRLMLGQRNGTILISVNSQPQTPPVSFQTSLVIPNVNMGGERGLTKIILDPNFNSNGYFYVYYTEDLVDQGRVSRFTYDPATRTASAASELIIWEDSTGFPGCCHYGGTMGFLEDGTLLVAIGDKFEASHAQDLTDPSGKLHRVNPALGWYNGTIPGNNVPPDNPLYDGTSGLLNANGEIQSLFAIGLRNPFTGYNDRRGASWKLYIAEVGGNDHSKAFEDVHLAQLSDIATGQLLNYGWPACGDGAGGQSGGTNSNGRNPVTGECINDNGLFTDPIFAYPHIGGQSIIMGFANEGGQLPAEYNNALFYGDYTKGFIKYIILDANGLIVDYPDGTPPGNPLSFHSNTDEIVSMAQGPDGSIYWMSLQRNTNVGYVHRINFTGGLAPVISGYNASPLSALAAPAEIAFDFTVTDVDNGPGELTYTLLFGDGNQVSGTMDAVSLPITHTYNSIGNYTAILQISDGLFTPSEEIIIRIGTPPTATITAPLQGELFVAGQLIDYSGTNSGVVLEEWFIELYNQGTLQPRFTGSGSGGSFTTAASAMNHVDFSFEKWYRITYRVTDANGLTSEDFVEIFPDEVNTTLTTNLQGVVLNIDGEPRATPHTFDDVKGFGHEISAPGEVCINSIRYIFDSWSDGGGQTHTITIPDTDQTFTANYIAAGQCGGLPVSGGLVMRLKGDSGLISSNGAVTGWTDMTASGNDLMVVSGSPTLVSGGLNGHDLVQFDGIDDALGKPDFTGLPLAATERSVFMMVQYETGKYGGFTYGNTAVNQVFGLMAKGNGCNAPKGTLAVDGWGCSLMLTSDEQAIGAGWLTHAAIFDGTTVVQYKDGQAIGSKVQAYNTTSGTIRMSAQHNDSKFTKMQVAEILVYDRALTEAERQAIENYFQQEYFQQASSTLKPATLNLKQATLTLNISLQGRGDYSGNYVIQLFRNKNTTPAFSFIATANATGKIGLEGIEPGDYSITIKHPQFLRRRENKSLDAGHNSLHFKSLFSGDANNDNQVTLLDLSVLSNTFNRALGATGYDPRADFNADGAVTLLDFSLMASNFNSAGD